MYSMVSLAVLALCWALALLSIPISFYTVKVKPKDVKMFRILSSYLVGSVLAYAIWLLTLRTGDPILDVSPLLFNLIAVLTPWILLIRREELSG